MEMNIKIKLQPLRVPVCVFVEPPVGERQEGFRPVEKYKLEELPPSTLAKLANQFRIDLFAQAKQEDPALKYQSAGLEAMPNRS